MDVVRTGGCMCGAVRFEAHGQPRFISNCHCHSCRRATGAAFSTWVGFASSDVRWTGSRIVHASSPDVQRSACAMCATPLSYSGRKWSAETHLLVGTFDQADDLVPTEDTNPEDRLAWVVIPTMRQS